MPLTLSSFTVGETGYVAKMNANNQAIIDYLAAYDTTQANYAASAGSVLAMQSAMFGASPAVFGDASYRTQAIGSDLIIAAGSAWAPSQQLVVRLLSGATVSMTGRAAGTYYINAVNGEPLTQPVISTIARDPLYSLSWSGSAISNLTRLASVIQRAERGPVDVTYAASMALDFGLGDTLRVRLTGNATITSILAAYDGQRCMLDITQDGTGGRTITPPSSVRIGSDVAWGVSAGPNTRTHLGLVFVASASVFDLVACARGF